MASLHRLDRSGHNRRHWPYSWWLELRWCESCWKKWGYQMQKNSTNNYVSMYAVQSSKRVTYDGTLRLSFFKFCWLIKSFHELRKQSRKWFRLVALYNSSYGNKSGSLHDDFQLQNLDLFYIVIAAKSKNAIRQCINYTSMTSWWRSPQEAPEDLEALKNTTSSFRFELFLKRIYLSYKNQCFFFLFCFFLTHPTPLQHDPSTYLAI